MEPAAENDLLFASTPPEFDAFHWHGDIFDLPAGAVGLARSKAAPCQAFRFEDRAYGILFHMEATPELVSPMADAFQSELREEGIDPSDLAARTAAGIAELGRIGRTVFESWAALLRPGS